MKTTMTSFTQTSLSYAASLTGSALKSFLKIVKMAATSPKQIATEEVELATFTGIATPVTSMLPTSTTTIAPIELPPVIVAFDFEKTYATLAEMRAAEAAAAI